MQIDYKQIDILQQNITEYVCGNYIKKMLAATFMLSLQKNC